MVIGVHWNTFKIGSSLIIGQSFKGELGILYSNKFVNRDQHFTKAPSLLFGFLEFSN